MNILINNIINDGITMISKERFDNIVNHSDKISKLEGDIVECGVWKGGMSIFLSKLFPTKKIWVCDSYAGCQDPSLGKYHFFNERHTLGLYAVSLEEVQDNFRKYDALDENRIFFLKGWVKDTLHPDVCNIKKISLLRVDVDSYSATLEVLDYLYDKVISGGMIIFDDSCLSESHQAMIEFFKRNDIKECFSPTEKILDINNNKLPCGCYIIKK
jgi:O-methyltransferase